jgi:hypothetical protein
VRDLCLTSTLSWREKVNFDDDEATKEMITIFLSWTLHLFAVALQQQLRMEYMSPLS